jgi:hypothetical protein
MSKHSDTGNTLSRKNALGNCSTVLGIYQIAVGIVLMTASASVYSLLHNPALLIPALMGAALLFPGVNAFLVCRDHSTFRGHRRTTG